MAGCQSLSRRASPKVGWAIGVRLGRRAGSAPPAPVAGTYRAAERRGNECLGVAGDAEAHVPGRAVRSVEASCRNSVAVAVGGVAEVGAAADRPGLPIEAVGAPFPDVAAGVEHADAVRLVGVDRAGAEPAVVAGVLLREVAL